jgi:hypothetical protein
MKSSILIVLKATYANPILEHSVILSISTAERVHAGLHHARSSPIGILCDASPRRFSVEKTVEMARDFGLLALFTSTPGFEVDVKTAGRTKMQTRSSA